MMLFIHYDYETPYAIEDDIIDMMFDTDTFICNAYDMEIDLMELDIYQIENDYKTNIYMSYFFVFLSIPFVKLGSKFELMFINFEKRDYKDFIKSLDYEKAHKFYELFTYIVINFNFLKYYPATMHMYKLTSRYFNLKFKGMVNIVNMELKLRK